MISFIGGGNRSKPRENDRLDKVYLLSLYKNITPVDEKCNGDKISIALEIVDWEFVQ